MTSTALQAKGFANSNFSNSTSDVSSFECLQLWHRMSNCCNLIEQELRSRFRTEFDSTLPRFNMLSQLQKSPDGLKMTELSKKMNVTNGNITGLTDQLVKDGLVKRIKQKNDRRSSIIKLTTQGFDTAKQMSYAYEKWLQDIFANSPHQKRIHLYESLGVLKSMVNNNLAITIN